MSQKKNKSDLKIFFIKLISIVFGTIIVINVSYNLIIAEKLENFSSKKNINLVKDKIRKEIRGAINKEKILNEEDKVLLYNFYMKIKQELENAEKN